MDGDWTFAIVSECQRFICCSVMDGTLDEGVKAAQRLRDSVPPPPGPAASHFLRATLLELAVRWAREQHRRVAHKCPVNPCTLATLADDSIAWRSNGEMASATADRFVDLVTAVRDELSRTHADSLSERALALVRQDAGHLTVASLSHALGTHPSTLRRAFQRELRITARELLARVRLERAEALLQEGERAKVEPVAYAVGWGSKQGLYRAFRNFRGATPGRARDGHEANGS